MASISTKKLHLMLLVVVCVPTAIYGQNNRVHGFAVDGNQGVAGLRIRSKSKQTRRPQPGGTTTENGYFNLINQEIGEIEIRIDGRGPSRVIYHGEASAGVSQNAPLPSRPEYVPLSKPKIVSSGLRNLQPVVIRLVKWTIPDPADLFPQLPDSSSVAGTVNFTSAAHPEIVSFTLTNTNTGKVEDTGKLFLNRKDQSEFEVKIATAGDYDLTFESEGFASQTFIVVKENPSAENSQKKVFAVFRSNGDLIQKPLSLEVVFTELGSLAAQGISESESVKAEEPAKRYIFLSRQMEALPVPGLRSFDYFALLAPGVVAAPQAYYQDGPGVSSGIGTAGQFAVNGLTSRENNFTVDGSDNNDEDIGVRRQGFVALTPQSIESLQEYQIITTLADSRFGRNLGGQIDALTKTGSPTLHGSAYGFFTSKRFNARNSFDQVASGASPPTTLRRTIDSTPVQLDGQSITFQNPVGGQDELTRTQAGFTAGGPFSLLKNTFFFTSLEYKDIRATRETHFAVPTVKQRGFFDTGETGMLLLPPIVGPNTPLFPASIPGNAIFSLYPFPNNPNGPYGENTYTDVLSADGKATLFSGKLDKQFGTLDDDESRPFWSLFSHGDVLTGRYNFTQDVVTLPTTGGAIFSSIRPRVRTQNVAFFLNRRLSANTSDTIRFSFGRTRLQFAEVRDPYLTPSFLKDTPFLLNAPLLLNVTAPAANGALNPTRYVSASSVAGTTLLNSLGYTSVTQTEQITGPLGQVILPGFSPLGVDVYSFPQSRANNTIQVADTITHVRNQHIITFGFDVRKTQINSTLDRDFRPAAVFNGLARNPSPNLAFISRPQGPIRTDFLPGSWLAAAGVPTGLFHTLAVTPDSAIGIRFTQGSVFVQDEWRLNPQFMLSAGLRYGRNSVPDTVRKRVEHALDPQELKRLAEQAVQTCSDPVRCGDLVQKLSAAFPADFTVSFGTDKNDFDVRLGVVVNPRKFSDFTLRGGFGTYSSQFPGIVLDQSRNAFPNFLPLNYANFSPRLGGLTYLFNLANPSLQQLDPNLRVIAPGTLNTFSGNNPINLLANRLVSLQNLSLASTILGLDLVLPQRKLRTAYSMQSAVTLERSFGSDSVLSASYVWTSGKKLLRITTPGGGTNDTNITSTTKVGPLTNLSSFPFFQGFFGPAQNDLISKSFVIAPTHFNSNGSSSYHSLQLEARKRYSRNFQIGSVLTYSHAIDDASDFVDSAGSFALPQSSLPQIIPAALEQEAERGSANFDVRLRSVTSFVVDIPYLNLNRGGFKSVFAKLQLAGVVTAQTGQPYTVNTIYDINWDGNATDRLDNTRGLIQGRDGSTQLRLASGVDPVSLLPLLNGQNGAVGRNTFRAPGLLNVDLSLSSSFSVRDHRTIQYRIEVFNLFNRANFGIPVRILEQPGFGKSTSTTLPARIIQFGLRYNF